MPGHTQHMLSGDAAADAPTPLDILLGAMHAKWRAGDHDAAAALARAAAPYIHPRRVARRDDAVDPRGAPHRMTDEQLLTLLRGDGIVSAAGNGAAGDDPSLAD